MVSDPILSSARGEHDPMLRSSMGFGDPLFAPAGEAGRKKVRTVETQYYRPGADVSLVCICGHRGTGKTTFSSHIARKSRKRLDNIGNPMSMSIWSNYELDAADYCSELLLDEMTEAVARPDNQFRYGMAHIDEIGRWANSKRPGTHNQVNIDEWLYFLRKQVIEPWSTTQFPQELPGTVSRQIDFVIMPEMLWGPWYVDEDGQRKRRLAIRTHWWNWNGSKTGRPHRGRYRHWPPPKWTADRTRTYAGVENTLGTFDTNAIVFGPNSAFGRQHLEMVRMGRELQAAFLDGVDAKRFEELTAWLIANPQGDPLVTLEDIPEGVEVAEWLTDATHRGRGLLLLETFVADGEVWVRPQRRM